MAGSPWPAGRVDGGAALYPTGRSRGTDRPPSVGPSDAGADAGGPAFRRYYEACAERWSGWRYALDKRFVHLTLLLDQGEEAQGPRWAAQACTFQDLREVLAAAPDPALVLLGPPGSGKSTLLQRVEVDCAHDALNGDGADPTNVPLPFFVSLNLYKAAAGDKLPSPKTWLEQHWTTRTDRYPELPPLDVGV